MSDDRTYKDRAEYFRNYRGQSSQAYIQSVTEKKEQLKAQRKIERDAKIREIRIAHAAALHAGLSGEPNLAIRESVKGLDKMGRRWKLTW